MPIRWFVFQDENRAVYRLEGDFNGMEEGNELLNSVDDLVVKGIKLFQLDFTHARYLSSYGIAILIRLKKKLVGKGADLRLMRVNKDIMRVLMVTRTDEFLINPDDEEATQ